MKKINNPMLFSMFLIMVLSISIGCKKDKKDPEPVVPAFIVTATTVTLNTGDAGLQFYAKCTNEDVKMTKANITDPIGATNLTYNLNGNYAVKNEIFALQADNEAYLKKIGTWTFTFVGNKTSDGTAFSANATLTVSK